MGQERPSATALSSRPVSYKAAIFRSAGHVDVIEKPYPPCGEDEVIVRNLMSGVCGSDVSAYRHGGDDHMIWKDHEFGHEAISEVVEIGASVKDIALGDHVFVNQGKALRDMRRMGTVGSFSEFIRRIPQCELGYSVIAIDKDIPVKTAVLFEPFVIGARGAHSLNPRPGKTAIVFGAGIIGIAAAVMLQYYGCDKVMIVDYSDKRLANARDLGLVTCNPATEDLKAKAIAEFGETRTFLGERCGAHLYIDATGVKGAIDSFAAIAGREAALAIVGVHHAPVPVDLLALCYSNWHISGCGSLPVEELAPDITAMMKSGRWNLSPLVSHEYPVDQIADALVMAGNAAEAQKVCVTF